MPGLDGFSVCRKLRESGDRTPFVLLTARDPEIDEVLGLELGAADDVTKPCSPQVLLARVVVLLRREHVKQADVREPEPLVLGPLHVAPERLEVRWQGQLIATTVTEFRMVDALARRSGVVLSRDRLLTLTRGDDSVVAERLIDTYVRRLRRKFEHVDPHFAAIETVIGAGYRWRHDG
jgi:DNA-binding response OmpR family regulator